MLAYLPNLLIVDIKIFVTLIPMTRVSRPSTPEPNLIKIIFLVIYIRKDCFQNKSKFITEDYFTKHMYITIL
jgi:hypothetical protein